MSFVALSCGKHADTANTLPPVAEDGISRIAEILPEESECKTRVVSSDASVKSEKKPERHAKKHDKGLLANTRDKMNVLATGTITAAELDKHFARMAKNSKTGKSILTGKGRKFIELEQKYGISARFMAGIATQESGAGTSNRARTKNDSFGMTGYKGRSWSSPEANIECAFSLIDRLYIKQGRKSIESIGKKYCATGGWARCVRSHMSKM